jgi:hypothetical protein
LGAAVINFTWDGRYPKKKQWCLDHVPARHNMILLLDADEVMTPALVQEIRAKGLRHDGYFMRGRYVMNGRALRYGLHNNKLSLIDRRKFAFPVVDDLGLPGMGAVEGHYQPVAKTPDVTIGRFREPLLHYASDGWKERHEGYAAWERGMNERKAWPVDPVPWRQALKQIFRALPGRPLWAFIHCYVVKRGFLDKKPGWDFACSRASYYAMIGRR